MRSPSFTAAVLGAGVILCLSPSPAMAGTAPSVPVTETQNGKTVTVHKGAHIKVLLHSTYWTIDASHGNALSTLTGQRTQGPSRPCSPPGSGCGTVTRYFLARALGTGYLTAHRTSCGEALKCSPAQGKYRVTIRVVR